MRTHAQLVFLALPAALAAALFAPVTPAATPDYPDPNPRSQPGVIGAASSNRVPESQNENSTNYDEVVRDLLTNLDKSPAAAEDSAIKLGGLGKRSLAPLIDTLTTYYARMKDDRKSKSANPKAEINEQVVLYSAIALARIKSTDAAKALLPLLLDTQASTNIRYTCVTAIGLEYSDEVVAALQKLAATDADIQLRRMAYNRLTAMPKQWGSSEKLFLDALKDPDAEIRGIAAKQFYFAAPVYHDAVPALLDFLGKEGADMPRIHAILAIARMRASEAVPFLMRLYSNDQTPQKVQQQCLRAINDIAGMNFKDGTALQTWWTKYGEKQYGKLEELLKKETEAAAAAGKDKTAQTPPIPPFQGGEKAAAPGLKPLKALPSDPVDGEIVRPASNPDDAPRVRPHRDADEK